MNKFLILLLALCLVSVHAFVKRDTPAENASGDFIDNARKQLEESWKKLTENVNPDTIKKGFNDAFGSINKAINDLKPTEPPKP